MSMNKKTVRDFRPYEPPLVVGEDADIITLVGEFIRNPTLHHLCVIDKDRRLLGLINRKRLFKSLFLHHLSPDTRLSKIIGLLTAERSSDLMVTHLITCTEDDSIHDVIREMIEHKIREVPVLDGQERVLGFITIPMIMREWLEENRC
ncbi:MAG TPA: CBS domain-containing protein [Nitrospirae bacterium]|nr:CBS domain-containing protein [Nitrospirota bacterium]